MVPHTVSDEVMSCDVSVFIPQEGCGASKQEQQLEMLPTMIPPSFLAYESSNRHKPNIKPTKMSLERNTKFKRRRLMYLPVSNAEWMDTAFTFTRWRGNQ